MNAPAVSSVSAGRKNRTWGSERKNVGRAIGWLIVSDCRFSRYEAGLYLVGRPVFASADAIVRCDVECR